MSISEELLMSGGPTGVGRTHGCREDPFIITVRFNAGLEPVSVISVINLRTVKTCLDSLPTLNTVNVRFNTLSQNPS